MRIGWSVLCFVAFATAAVAAEGVNVRPVRNPFWPVGYQGRREAISDGWAEEKRQSDESARLAAELAEREAAEVVEPVSAGEQMWAAARAVLKPGGVITYRDDESGEGQYALINGRVFKVGDCVTVRMDGRLFKWMIRSFDVDGRIRMDRIGVRTENTKGSEK